MAYAGKKNNEEEGTALVMGPSHSNLINLQRYLGRYPQHDQPAAFEYLVANTVSQIFYLPFQSKDNEDNTVSHRVIWYGSINKKTKIISKSPSGPDSICFGYGFDVLIESTLRDGTNQWRKEFIESLKHYDNFVRNKGIDKKDVYLTLIVRKLHKDTYMGFKEKAKDGYNIIILEGSSLAKIGNISKMLFTVRHLDIRQLFNDLVKKLRESTSFDKFRDESNKSIYEWEKDVLKREKTVFFGLKSYEAIKKVGKNIVGTSDILLNLHKDSKFNRYIKILGGGDLTSYIREGLLSERLAYLISTPDEDLFCRVNSADFKSRGLRLIKTVEEIYG